MSIQQNTIPYIYEIKQIQFQPSMSQKYSSSSSVISLNEDSYQKQSTLLHFQKPFCLKHKRQIQFICLNFKCKKPNSKRDKTFKRTTVCCLFCYRQHSLHIQDVYQISQLCKTIPMKVAYIDKIFNKRVLNMQEIATFKSISIKENIDQQIDQAQLNCLKILKRENFDRNKNLHSLQCQNQIRCIENTLFDQNQHDCIEQVLARLQRIAEVNKTIQYFCQLKNSNLLTLKLKCSSKKGLLKFQQKQNWLRGYLQNAQREKIHLDIQFLKSRIPGHSTQISQSFQEQLRMILQSYRQIKAKRIRKKKKESRK